MIRVCTTLGYATTTSVGYSVPYLQQCLPRAHLKTARRISSGAQSARQYVKLFRQLYLNKQSIRAATSEVEFELETVDEDVAGPSTVLMFGFHPETVSQVALYLGQFFPEWRIIGVAKSGLEKPIDELSEADEAQDEGDVALGLGQLVVCCGECKGHMSELEMMLYDDERPSPIFGTVTAASRGQALREVVAGIRAAHARMHRLIQPVATDPDVTVPADAAVAMNLVLDGAVVPRADGEGEREDSSHVVVIDGLVSEPERQQILDWMTQEGWDHTQPPPAAKWAQHCVDRPDVRPSWGLTSDMLWALRHDPPPAIIALQSRLAALYPEYVLAHMPVAALEEEGVGDDDEAALGLSPFVGNAVMAGDAPGWHVDADPALLPAKALWVQQHGWYINREAGKPLFISALVYLNPHWTPEQQAETLFLDPDSGTGVFVQPRPGRVVLMDQDTQHRIAVPSPSTKEARYSLVWKLVMWPKEEAGGQEGAPMSLARPQWGPPLRFGSAAGRVGVPVLGQQ